MDTEPSSLLFLVTTANIDASFFIYLAILLLLLLGSALISGSEVAFFSLGPNEKETLNLERTKASQTTIGLINMPKDLLATILIANNFINVAIVILSSYLFAVIYPEPVNGIDWIRSIVEVAGITFIILLIGEVIPKVYANRNALKLALFMARPISVLAKTPPISWMKLGLVKGTDFINKAAKKRMIDVSTDDLEHALALTKEETGDEGDHKILEGIVKFGNTDVKQIMCSRVDVEAIDINETYEELMSLVLEAGYSRIPVYKDNFDEVVGILYVKDLLPYLSQGGNIDWKTLIRTPFFVPEN